MKNSAKFYLIGLLGAFTLTGCNKGGYTIEPPKVLSAVAYTPGKEAELFPMVKGSEWVYEVDITVMPNDGKQTRQVSQKELMFRCTRVNTVGGNTRAIMEAVLEGQVNERQEWLLTKEGLYQVSVGSPSKPFSPAQPVWRIPLAKDSQFSWSGTGFVADGVIRACRTKSVHLGEQVVDTLLGTAKSQAVQTLTVWNDGKNDWQSSNTTWWTPGIGIVRYRQESVTKQGVAVQVMRLKAYSLK